MYDLYFSKPRRPTDKTSLEDRLRPGDMYLQKTLPGGIMLIELGFREVYFCVNVYAFECSRLAKAVVNRQVRNWNSSFSPISCF